MSLVENHLTLQYLKRIAQPSDVFLATRIEIRFCVVLIASNILFEHLLNIALFPRLFATVLRKNLLVTLKIDFFAHLTPGILAIGIL